MMDLAQITLLKKKRPSAVLALALDGGRLEGVLLRRTNGSLQSQESFSAALSLDMLTADPELVGREIRNHLDAAEIRERECILGLPLKWALTTHIELPDLADADVASFLQIEAERGFPCDPDTLVIASSRYQAPSGKQHAMLVGIPRSHIERVEEVLRAAKLKPLSFGLGLVALQPPAAENPEGVLALAIAETHVGLLVTCGGGLVALRTLEGALELEAGRRILHPDLIARETRITLGQLPADVRDAIRGIRIFGPRDLAQQLADELELRLEALGLKIELVEQYGAEQFKLKIPAGHPVSAAFSLGAAQLAGVQPHLQFLPPKVTAWQRVATRYSSGKLRFAGAVAAAVMLLVVGLFAIQQWRLVQLTSRWNAMSTEVTELQTVQDQIRQFRPWYDESFRGLSILRQLASAFPEEGVVSAKTVEIRDLTAVTCSGTARDNQALLKTLDRLRAAGGVSDLKVDQIRGRSPMQFTFDFRWSEGGKSEN